MRREPFPRVQSNAAAAARRFAVFRALRFGDDAAQRAGVHPGGDPAADVQAQPLAGARSPGAAIRSACSTTWAIARAPAFGGAEARRSIRRWSEWWFRCSRGTCVRPRGRYLEGEMSRAAGELRFEVAQAATSSGSTRWTTMPGNRVIVSARIVDVDVFSLLPDDDVAWCNFVRDPPRSVVGVQTVKLRRASRTMSATC